MRQPSTPWITFDRDSRVAAGEMSVPQVVLSHFRRSIHDGMFKQAEAAHVPDPTPSSRFEPSTLIVAQDVEIDVAEEGFEDAFLPKPRRGVKMIAAGIFTIGIMAIGIATLQGSIAERATASAAKQVVSVPAAIATTVIAPPADVTPPAPPPVVAKPALAKDDPRAKLGRLAIRGDAVRTNVWLDGKRMLGRGPRAFDVMCGQHMIAIGEKKDATEMEIPCAGELVLSNAK